MSELITNIFKLSRIEQITLAQLILDNIATEEQENANSWLTIEVKQELDKRSEAIKNKTAKLTSWEEVQNKINNKYGFDNTI